MYRLSKHCCLMMACAVALAGCGTEPGSPIPAPVTAGIQVYTGVCINTQTIEDLRTGIASTGQWNEAETEALDPQGYSCNASGVRAEVGSILIQTFNPGDELTCTIVNIINTATSITIEYVATGVIEGVHMTGTLTETMAGITDQSMTYNKTIAVEGIFAYGPTEYRWNIEGILFRQ